MMCGECGGECGGEGDGGGGGVGGCGVIGSGSGQKKNHQNQ